MTEIELWLRNGAEVQEGLRLLSIYKPNPHLEKMVRNYPSKYHNLLIRALGGIDRKSLAESASREKGFREQWPFLSDTDCPLELKILAADKITAYRNFAREHQKLYSCTSPESCLEVAKSCVFFYCQNRKIFSEFAYYKEHRQILGKHEIFDEVRRLKDLRHSGPLELVKKRDRLKDSIWRLQKLLRTGDKPHLAGDRTELLISKQRELTEIVKLLKDYEDAYGK